MQFYKKSAYIGIYPCRCIHRGQEGEKDEDEHARGRAGRGGRGGGGEEEEAFRSALPPIANHGQ